MLHTVMKLAKTTLKLLFRSRGFLILAIGLPMLATLLLNLNLLFDGAVKEQNSIEYLAEANSHISYSENVEKYAVRCYDRLENENSVKLMEALGSAGNFRLFAIKASDMTKEEVLESARLMASHDMVNAILIIDDSISLYRVTEDERFDLLVSYLNTASVHIANEGSIPSIQKTIHVNSIEREDENANFLELACDFEKINIAGNMIGLMSVAFLFTGVLILGTIFRERDNLVYTRILLSGVSPAAYLISKYLLVVLTSILQALVATLSYCVFVIADCGLSSLQFFCVLLSISLIFNTFSVGVGIFTQNTMSATLFCFGVWVITNIVGGVYFDISNATMTYKRLSLLTPQRWAVLAVSNFVSGNSIAYLILFAVTITYIIMILLVGTIGLRMMKKD